MKKTIFLQLGISILVAGMLLICAAQSSAFDTNPSSEYRRQRCIEDCRYRYAADATHQGALFYSRCIENCEDRYKSQFKRENRAD